MEEEKTVPGSIAVELIRELRRAEGKLLPFQEEKRRQVCDEINALYNNGIHLARNADYEKDSPLLILYQEGIQRNKRCMLAYLRARLELIERLRWEVGIVTMEHKEKLSPFELNYSTDYNLLLAKYMETTGIDVTNSTEQPPDKLLIEVKVLQDFGTVILDDGTSLVLKENKRIYLSRADADPFIKQGILEHIC